MSVSTLLYPTIFPTHSRKKHNYANSNKRLGHYTFIPLFQNKIAFYILAQVLMDAM